MTSPDPLGLTPLQRALSDATVQFHTRVAMNVTKEAARRSRANIRAASARTELTLDAVLEKLGWSREYAEHFVQPYCTCDDTYDGWMYCEHARDEGVHS